jgi:type III secretion protein Q
LVAVERAAQGAASRARTWYCLRLQGEGVAWFSCIRVPQAVMDAMLVSLTHRAACQAALFTGGAASLPLRGRIRLCDRTLPSSALLQIERSDVVIMPLPADVRAESLPVVVRWGAREATSASALAVLEDRTLTFKGGVVMDAEVVDHDDQSLPAENSARVEHNALDELELPVHFELDTVAMPLGELRSVQEGYVIELPTPLNEATVRLVACGQTVAHAELVAVGERLGARITRMLLQEGERAEPG